MQIMTMLKNFVILLLTVSGLTMIISSCTDSNSPDDPATTNDFELLLIHQVDSIIIPATVNFTSKMDILLDEVNEWSLTNDDRQVATIRSTFKDAYRAYQRVAVHNYFATNNQGIIRYNLFPIDTTILNQSIDQRSYNFNNSSQDRANGFPALEYLLFGDIQVNGSYTSGQPKYDFIKALTSHIRDKALAIRDSWQGNLRQNFIENGGTQLGSSISVQLNESLLYWERHVRENKVGIPIGRLGPLDSPIESDPNKREARYISEMDGDDQFALEMVRIATKEMQAIFQGGVNNGYDILLEQRNQPAVANEIHKRYTAVYDAIANRSSITGDEVLYNAIQSVVTIYKSDLLPLLNVQDADGANDGD